MSRKVFISFLGTGCYKKCMYRYPDGTKSNSVSFVQEATLDYLTKKEEWADDSVAYILLTDEAEEKNWDDGYEFELDDGSTYEQDYGLETKLQKLKAKKKLALAIEPVRIDDKTVSDFWSLFMLVLEKIQNGDELYLDVTHGFRYLPMFLLVFCNYTKFLKQVKVRHISYGNWEALDKGTNVAPIVDLLPLSELQDWTFAAGQYLETGNVDRLVDLSNKEILPILKESKGKNEEAKQLKVFVKYLNDLIQEFKMCRGINIVESKNLRIVKQAADNLESTFIEPLNPIFDKLKKSLENFDEKENFKNGFEAALWCLNNGLYQQAATIAQENVVTMLCIIMGYDWRTEDSRNIVDIAFKVELDSIPQEKWNLKLKSDATEEKIQKRISDINNTLSNPLFQSLVKEFSALKDLRNDLNHSGMRNNPLDCGRLKTKIEERINMVISIINQHSNLC